MNVAYTTRILPFARKQIARWGLPAGVLVDVYLQLNEVLPSGPQQRLLPNSEERGGMLFYFSMVDPENRFRQHSFAFRVFYGQDEQTLLVASGVYRMDIEA
jgi:hypothetical protein